MGMTNDEVIKAAITAADALASNGKLNPSNPIPGLTMW